MWQQIKMKVSQVLPTRGNFESNSKGLMRATQSTFEENRSKDRCVF